MKNLKYSISTAVVILFTVLAYSFTITTSTNQKKADLSVLENPPSQTLNLFVTHGHCSTPFAGKVTDFELNISNRKDGGNPLEDMGISFEVDPNSFNACAGNSFTNRIKTPGLFISENNENITFRSTQVYTMGLDWYQLNGKMAIKGIEKNVKLFITGIRDSKDMEAHSLVISGKVDLSDWGIDYDKIVSGKSDSVPTKWLYLNMQVEI